MYWIKRTFESFLAPSTPQLRNFPVWLLLGPRQVGKSSLLKRLGPNRDYINLDDPAVRLAATEDPIAFSGRLRTPLIVDEIQYAPQLLSNIKMIADASKEPGAIWLTGSQSFEVMKGVHESLAGRVTVLTLLGLSDEEKFQEVPSVSDYFRSIFQSTFPRLNQESHPEAIASYLSSYVETYVERDIRELLGIQKRREFEVFLKVCALRTGQIVNFDDMGRDAGVSGNTAKEWVSLLEDSFLLKLIYPYYSNRTKRLVKSPRLYFLDAGLAAYLSGWRDPDMLAFGAMKGALFETHIFGELWRWFKHRALGAEFSFWRTRDNVEIDLLIEFGGSVYPIEIKSGDVRRGDLVSLEKIREANWNQGQVITLSMLGRETGTNSEMKEGWRLCSPLQIGNSLFQRP